MTNTPESYFDTEYAYAYLRQLLESQNDPAGTRRGRAMAFQKCINDVRNILDDSTMDATKRFAVAHRVMTTTALEFHTADHVAFMMAESTATDVAELLGQLAREQAERFAPAPQLEARQTATEREPGTLQTE